MTDAATLPNGTPVPLTKRGEPCRLCIRQETLCNHHDPAKEGAGAKTKLTPQLQARLIRYVKEGATRKDAARLVGIHPSTIRDWERRGEEGEEPYSSFSILLRRAELHMKARALGVVNDALEAGDVGVAKWLLARRWPGEYGRKRAVDPSSRGGDGARRPPMVTTVVEGVDLSRFPGLAQDPGEVRRVLRDAGGES